MLALTSFPIPSSSGSAIPSSLPFIPSFPTSVPTRSSSLQRSSRQDSSRGSVTNLGLNRGREREVVGLNLRERPSLKRKGRFSSRGPFVRRDSSAAGFGSGDGVQRRDSLFERGRVRRDSGVGVGFERRESSFVSEKGKGKKKEFLRIDTPLPPGWFDNKRGRGKRENSIGTDFGLSRRYTTFDRPFSPHFNFSPQPSQSPAARNYTVSNSITPFSFRPETGFFTPRERFSPADTFIHAPSPLSPLSPSFFEGVGGEFEERSPFEAGILDEEVKKEWDIFAPLRGVESRSRNGSVEGSGREGSGVGSVGGTPTPSSGSERRFGKRILGIEERLEREERGREGRESLRGKRSVVGSVGSARSRGSARSGKCESCGRSFSPAGSVREVVAGEIVGEEEAEREEVVSEAIVSEKVAGEKDLSEGVDFSEGAGSAENALSEEIEGGEEIEVGEKVVSGKFAGGEEEVLREEIDKREETEVGEKEDEILSEDIDVEGGEEELADQQRESQDEGETSGVEAVGGGVGVGGETRASAAEGLQGSADNSQPLPFPTPENTVPLAQELANEAQDEEEDEKDESGIAGAEKELLEEIAIPQIEGVEIEVQQEEGFQQAVEEAREEEKAEDSEEEDQYERRVSGETLRGSPEPKIEEDHISTNIPTIQITVEEPELENTKVAEIVVEDEQPIAEPEIENEQAEGEDTNPEEADEDMATLDPGDSRRRGRSKSPGPERSRSRGGPSQYEVTTERERSRVRVPSPPSAVRGYDDRERERGYDDRYEYDERRETKVVSAEPRSGGGAYMSGGGGYGQLDRYREESPPRKSNKYRDDSPPRKGKYRDDSPPRTSKMPGGFKSTVESDSDSDEGLAYGKLPPEKKDKKKEKERKDKEKEEREFYEREKRRYTAGTGKYEAVAEVDKYKYNEGRRYDDESPGRRGRGASFNVGIGQHALSGGIAVQHAATSGPQYAPPPTTTAGGYAGGYQPPPSPGGYAQPGYSQPSNYQPPPAGYLPPTTTYQPPTLGGYQPPYSAPEGPPPGRAYAQPAQYQYAQPDALTYGGKRTETTVATYARPPSPKDYASGHHSRHGSTYANESPRTSQNKIVTVEPGSGRRRDASPNPAAGLAPRMHSLSVSTGHHGSASLSLANAPGSPLLEAYHGTYQSISPMPSPMMMPHGSHGNVNLIEPLSPADYSSDDSRRPGGSSKPRRTARFHDPAEEAKLLAAALRGDKKAPDSGPLIEILPGLTHEQVMDLRVEYKRIVKTGSEKKGVNIAKHIKLRLKDEDSSLMKACYACALGKWESEAYWANFWYQGEKSRRELLIESLMGRTNSEIRAIKDGFADKKYSDSLTKCMRTELKEDKFKKAVLLVLEERKMEGPVDDRLVEDDVRELHRAVRSERGGETAMINIVCLRSDAHLGRVLTVYDSVYGGNFAREMLKKSGNLVGELLAHILNGVINKPVRDALLVHHALSLSRSDSIRTELLISRLVRYHWDRPHMEAVKREYRNRYGIDMRTAVKEGTRGDWGRFCEGLCVRRMGDEVRRVEEVRYFESGSVGGGGRR